MFSFCLSLSVSLYLVLHFNLIMFQNDGQHVPPTTSTAATDNVRQQVTNISFMLLSSNYQYTISLSLSLFISRVEMTFCCRHPPPRRQQQGRGIGRGIWSGCTNWDYWHHRHCSWSCIRQCCSWEENLRPGSRLPAPRWVRQPPLRRPIHSDCHHCQPCKARHDSPGLTRSHLLAI